MNVKEGAKSTSDDVDDVNVASSGPSGKGLSVFVQTVDDRASLLCN